jgi:hypothetical protein
MARPPLFAGKTGSLAYVLTAPALLFSQHLGMHSVKTVGFGTRGAERRSGRLGYGLLSLLAKAFPMPGQ